MTIERLGGFDTSLVRLESTRQPMTISLLMELDPATVPGGYSFAGFRDELLARIEAVPEFREMLVDAPLRWGNPLWVRDPAFDVDRHLHRVELPAAAGRDALSTLAGDLIATPLYRDRPLWEMWVIERGPRSINVLTKIHHCMMDGTSSRDLFSRLYSTEPVAVRPDPVAGADPASRRELVRDALSRSAARLRLLLGRVLPRTVLAVSQVIRRVLAGRGTTGVLSAPRTPFNAGLTAGRSVAWVRIDLAEVKAVKNTFGVKVNDVMLALVSGALRRYLLDRGELPSSSLVAMMPIGVVDESDGGGRNNMSAMFARLHTDIADPLQRLDAIAEASAVAKEVSSTIGGTLLRDWTECTPRVLEAAMRLYVRSGLTDRRPLFNLSVSNVIGSQVPSFLLGTSVGATYPLGPVLNGVGLNISLGSYNGGIDIGVVACRDLLPDVWRLVDGIPVALDELLDAARARGEAAG